jgi:hypothetical protein
MSSLLPPEPPPRRTFFSRRFAPLVAAWVGAIIVVGLIYWFEHTMPAFDEVVAPLYAVIALLLTAFTWRWIRTRGKGERRHNDRRRTDRRNTAEYSTKPPES